jgi:hypothetical protein
MSFTSKIKNRTENDPVRLYFTKNGCNFNARDIFVLPTYKVRGKHRIHMQRIGINLFRICADGRDD